MTSGGTLLVDVGSTVVKVCTRLRADRFSAVERIGRIAGVSPGDQVGELVAERRRTSGVTAVRVCSSANGGVPVGILGLSGRHSVAAAARAAVAAGGNVRYERLLTGPSNMPAPPVDVLVLTGGVDGADHHRLRDALAGTRLADHPHEILVWAGADAAEVTALLPPHRRATNVLDRHLRPCPGGLTDLVRDIYTSDLVGRKGLGALADVTEAPIWPTPAVVGLAAERLSRHRLLPDVAAPFVLLDVGGATTDAFVCAELRRGHPPRGGPPDPSVVRHVFTDLGVAVSAPALLGRLAADPGLFELVRAVAPERSRGLHHDLSAGHATALTAPVGFLCCLFLALRRLTAPDGPHQIDVGRAASIVVTGGARSGASTAQIHRVVDAAAGGSEQPREVVVDHHYLLWAYGIQDVPARSPVSPLSC
ncbi:glutamate mutase L [Micromonospora narathiwatensis]|uniref:MutL protein n=1 Tax=Micromonospora narathiwatensis TaxID=299146 RepID=A0A1A8ZBC0_9ACTN|nr:glutamate mutase L [Micromonospora narathiwatensis]SBT41103.1 conserved hypothetical protein [Micromonospora narathiwatensis]